MRIADYELVRERAGGNHGTYWLARPPARLGLAPGEMVDLKVIDRQASEQDFARIVGELRIASRLDSPHLVPVLDAGHERGRLFMAMPHYEDGVLADLDPSTDRVRILTSLADAAQGAHELHEAGVVHRDIRPVNIHLEGDRGRLGDLGLAGVLDPAASATGIGPVGVVEYLAPEQIRGSRAGRASDIWALGVTMHRALTGHGVHDEFATASLVEGLRIVLTTPPAIRLPENTAEGRLVRWCLAPNPADRPGTAADLAGAIREAVRE